MVNFEDYTYDAENENICSLFSKFNLLLQDLNSDVLQTNKLNTVTSFTIRRITNIPDRFMYIQFNVSGIDFGIMNASGTVISKFTYSVLGTLSPDASTKFGYISDSDIRNLGNLLDKEFIAKQHLYKELDAVSGTNPSLVFEVANLLSSFNIVKNLTINPTSTTASIEIEDEGAGLGQVLSCYVTNNSASNVAITLLSSENIKYPQNLDTGVSRAGDVVTISANKEYLITFLRSREDIWSFNILEQNN